MVRWYAEIWLTLEKQMNHRFYVRKEDETILIFANDLKSVLSAERLNSWSLTKITGA